ncbi:gluconokinase [Roseobacter sp.]|uniref:gluconokinase n=1 Tax=Roseobacter sp. TaxID=1907202 RepID=UPI0025D29D85|nr:gluconokinase [Roseobacter sp.]
MQRYVVMGVSGCGKTSVGTGFARAIGAQFIDGDDLHPAENVAKMSRGEPLDDGDRGPWLAAVAAALARARGDVVIGCSALRRRYRDLIRDGAGSDVVFLHLSGSRDLIAGRMGAREGHFMPLTLLDSQFAALEPPGPDETCVTVDIDQTEEQVVRYLTGQTQHLRAADLA